MTLFEANAKLREISIRKVLGASVTGLVALLTKKYFNLVGVSTLIALPIIYLTATEWLDTYLINNGISWTAFFVPFVTIIFLIAITSSFQTIKAAQTNPVDNLKHE